MSRHFIFTSESVSEGHPDKLADQISDAILDLFLAEDPSAKVACETLVTDERVIVTGEFRIHPASGFADLKTHIEPLVRQVLRDAGYDASFPGINPDTCEVQLYLNAQSDDIHRGVEREGGEIGAGDQGLVFGYATDETPERLPLTLLLAHRLVQRQAALRKDGTLPWLKPDAKSQVTVRYGATGPEAVTAVVFSTQHSPDINAEALRRQVISHIIEPVIPPELRDPRLVYHINPTGNFVVGGPKADVGLTGRKIIVDTYGGACPHGGGAFSGKDPTKVDRSAAYAARQIAKTIVNAQLARRCTVQLAYAIGVAAPVSLLVDTHGTGVVEDDRLERAVREHFTLTPSGIISTLGLRTPLYRPTATYGHFGRPDLDLPWERTPKVDALRLAVQQKPLSLIQLDRFYREANSGDISPEMQAWWWNRY